MSNALVLGIFLHDVTFDCVKTTPDCLISRKCKCKLISSLSIFVHSNYFAVCFTAATFNIDNSIYNCLLHSCVKILSVWPV